MGAVTVAEGVPSASEETGAVRRPLQYSRPATSPTTQSMPSSSPSPMIAEHGTIRHLWDSICSKPSACGQPKHSYQHSRL